MLLLKAYYSTLFQSLLTINQRFLSNSVKKLPSLNAQKSVLATAVIRQIVSSKPTSLFHKLSLRERVLKVNPLIDNREISKQAKDEIFGLFTNGIPLNYKVYSKGREQYPRQTEEFKQFVFSPTHLTTKPIFKNIFDKNVKSTIREGQFGTGKTTSYLLYMELSRHVHRFYFQAQQNSQAQFEQRKLIRSYLLEESPMPKYFYWSADAEQNMDSSFNICDLIYEQTLELPKSKRKMLQSKLKTQNQFLQQCKRIYQGKMGRALIIDQFHSLAQLGYEGSKSNDNPEPKPLEQNQKPQSKQETENKLIRLNGFKDTLSSFASHCIFVSSTNIQRQMEGILKATRQTQSFHKLLTDGKWAMVDFAQYFWFEIQRILLVNNNSLRIDQIKHLFLDIIAQKKKEVKSYSRFVDIRNFLKDHSSDCLSIAENQSKEQIGNKMNKLITQFNEYCLGRMRDQLRILLQSNYDELSPLLKELYEEMLILCQKGDRYQSRITSRLPSFIWKHHPRSKSQTNSLFYYLSLSQNQISFYLGNNQVAQILSGVLDSEAKACHQRKSQLKQNLLKSITIKGGPKMLFPIQYMKQGKKITKQLAFNIKDRCVFDSSFFGLSTVQRSFIELMRRSQQKSDVVGIPLQQLKGVDFAVGSAVGSPKQRSFTIYTFDILLSNNKSQIQRARRFAIEQFQRKLHYEVGTKVEIQHIIICEPTQALVEQDRDIKDSRLKMYYCNWKQLEKAKWITAKT